MPVDSLNYTVLFIHTFGLSVVLLTRQRYNHEGYNVVGIVILMKWVSAQLSNSQVVPVEVQAAFMPKKDGQLWLKTAE